MSDKINIQKLRTKNISNPGKEPNTEKTDWFAILNKDIQLRKTKLSDKNKEDFYLELWSLLSAGIDIRTALELVRDEQKKKSVKEVFARLTKQVIAGITLSTALQNNNEFTSYEYHSIRIGEETGRLTGVLKELADFFQKKIKQRRQIVSALTYPVLVMVVAIGAVSFMISFVVPMFSDTFKRFGSDLPTITKAVIAVSAAVKKFSGIVFICLAGSFFFAFTQRQKTWFRSMNARVLLKIPLIGTIVSRIYLSRFANTLSLLTAAKIPMIQAIQLTRQMIGFYPIEQSLYTAEQRIMAGDYLYQSLKGHNVYPQKMISIIKVAEEVNQLELFLARLAEQYANEVEYQTGMLSKFLEPIIIVVLGLVVGIILIAMYLPLFKLGQGF